MTLRELITRIGFRVDTKGLAVYDKAIGRVYDKTDKMFNNLNRVAQGISSVGRKMSLGITLPLAAIGTASVMAASSVQSLQVSLTTMLGSADKANNLIRDMISFAAKTPFQLEEVEQNAQMLIAMGFSADQLIPTLQSLGDIAAGTGANLTRMALNLGQVKTQGKLTGPDLRDFLVNRVPLITELAKQLGVTETKVKGMVSASQVSFDDVMASFKQMTSEGGRFFGLMDARSRTIGGMISNILDATFRIRVSIGKVMIETFHFDTILKKFLVVVDKLATEIENAPKWLKKLVAWVALLIALIGPALVLLGGVITGFLTLKFVSYGLTVALDGVSLSLKKVIISFASLFLEVALVIAALVALLLIIDDLKAFSEGRDSLFGRMLSSLDPWLEKIKTKSQDLVDDIISYMEDKLDAFVTWFREHFQPLIDTFNFIRRLNDKFFARDQGGSNYSAIAEYDPNQSISDQLALGGTAGSFIGAGSDRTPVRIVIDAKQNVNLSGGATEENTKEFQKQTKEYMDEILGVTADQLNSEVNN